MVSFPELVVTETQLVYLRLVGKPSLIALTMKIFWLMQWLWDMQIKIKFFTQKQKELINQWFMLAQKLVEMEFMEQLWLLQSLMKTLKKKNQLFK